MARKDQEPSPKDWLEPMILAWRDQVFYMWHGVDGWSVRNVLARIIEEGAGASHEGRGQRVYEVYHRDGLAIWRAIQGMPYQPRVVLVVHYLADGNAAEKAVALGVKKSRYWDLLDNAYHYLAGRLEAACERRESRALST
jgi:DNA-directed RNA polymerase specialized sigma24 family protein